MAQRKRLSADVSRSCRAHARVRDGPDFAAQHGVVDLGIWHHVGKMRLQVQEVLPGAARLLKGRGLHAAGATDSDCKHASFQDRGSTYCGCLWILLLPLPNELGSEAGRRARVSVSHKGCTLLLVCVVFPVLLLRIWAGIPDHVSVFQSQS